MVTLSCTSLAQVSTIKNVFAATLVVTLAATIISLHREITSWTKLSSAVWHVDVLTGSQRGEPAARTSPTAGLLSNESNALESSVDLDLAGVNKTKIILALAQSTRLEEPDDGGETKLNQGLPGGGVSTTPLSPEPEVHIEGDLGSGVDLDFDERVPPPACWPVLKRSTDGWWVPRSYSKKEFEDLERSLKLTREDFRASPTLDRLDGRCGNLTDDRGIFRALCNPAGPFPCCYSNHRCVNFSVSECLCDDCIDMRRAINAELAEWTPHDRLCKLHKFQGEETVCPLIRNTTILFIGDSFMRHFYRAFSTVIHGDNFSGGRPLKYPNATKNSEIELLCRDEFYYYHRVCSGLLLRDAVNMNITECGAMADVRFAGLNKLKHAQAVLETIKGYFRHPNTFIIMGVGVHGYYDAQLYINKLLSPALELLATSRPWPHLIWAAPHEAGFLKSPHYGGQLFAGSFNAVVTPYMRRHGIPVLDFYAFTNNAVQSYDGTHYGKGVNEVKVQILLNYFAELRWKT